MIKIIISLALALVLVGCDGVVDTYHTLPIAPTGDAQVTTDATPTPDAQPADTAVPADVVTVPADAVADTVQSPSTAHTWAIGYEFAETIHLAGGFRLRVWVTGFRGPGAEGEYELDCTSFTHPMAHINSASCIGNLPGEAIGGVQFSFAIGSGSSTVYVPGYTSDPNVVQTFGLLDFVLRDGVRLFCEPVRNGQTGSSAGWNYGNCQGRQTLFPADAGVTPTDSGTPVVDAGTPVADSGTPDTYVPPRNCTLRNGNPCSHGGTCVSYTCADGSSEMSACSNGTVTVTRPCPTPVADAGVGPAVDTVTVVGSPRWTVTSFQARLFAESGGSVNVTCTDGAPSINSVCTGSIVPPFRVSVLVVGTSFPDTPNPSVRSFFDPGVWTRGGSCQVLSTFRVALASGRSVACDRADNGQGGCDLLCH